MYRTIENDNVESGPAIIYDGVLASTHNRIKNLVNQVNLSQESQPNNP
jgi:hypothetical protein